MKKVKLAIVYYSSTGTNYQLAEWAREAAEEAGAEVRLRKMSETMPKSKIDANPAWRAHLDATSHIKQAESDDLAWADAILFSVPARFGNVPAQAKQFFDQQGGLWAKGALSNKVVSAMTSAQNPHGGQEATIQALYVSMMHWGAIIVAPGYTDDSVYEAGGNPYGTSVTQGEDGKPVENAREAVRHQVGRTVEVASWITAASR